MQDARLRDLDLVHACLNGDRDAWERMVIEHTDVVRWAVLRTLQRYAGHADDALVEDLTSRLFLSLMLDDARRLRQFSGRARLKTWLRVAAVNTTRDHLRRRRPTDEITELQDGPRALIADTPPPDDALSHRELVDGLRAMWDQLPEDDRAFVEMFFVDELSFAEISERTGATAGALYARKNRIRHRLIALAEEAGWFEHRSSDPATRRVL